MNLPNRKTGLRLHIHLHSLNTSVYKYISILIMSNKPRLQYFGVQSLEEFLNTDTPFLSWEDLQQKLLLPPQDRPSMREPTASNSIESLLSASSYPVPEMSIPQNHQRQEVPLYGGFFIGTPSSQNGLDQSVQSISTPVTGHARRRSESITSNYFPRKRGRPRKDVADVLDEDSEEVCTKVSYSGPRFDSLQ